MNTPETPATNDRMFDCLISVGDPMVEHTTPVLVKGNTFPVIELVDKIQQKSQEEKKKLDKEKF